MKHTTTKPNPKIMNVIDLKELNLVNNILMKSDKKYNVKLIKENCK